MMTRQEIFNVVWNGLKAQGFKRSMAPMPGEASTTPSCAYRGNDGCKCAFGHLIPDELYSKKLENWTIASFARQKPVNPNLKEFYQWFDSTFDRNDHAFIAELQNAHDVVVGTDYMEKLFRSIAAFYKLKIPGE